MMADLFLLFECRRMRILYQFLVNFGSLKYFIYGIQIFLICNIEPTPKRQKERIATRSLSLKGSQRIEYQFLKFVILCDS
jgi:hypothetical protein